MKTLVDIPGWKIIETDIPGQTIAQITVDDIESTIYMQGGKVHREGGPAVSTADEQSWFINGLMHRDDGPAHLVKSSKTAFWWMEGKPVTSSVLPDEVFNSHWKT